MDGCIGVYCMFMCIYVVWGSRIHMEDLHGLGVLCIIDFMFWSEMLLFPSLSCFCLYQGKIFTLLEEEG